MVLKFIYGGQTYALSSATNSDALYQLDRNSWAPAISTVLPNQLGAMYYRPVQETFSVTIFGSTADACLGAYRDLVVLLNVHALRYHRGLSSTPVYFEAQLHPLAVSGGLRAMIVPPPDGSTLESVQSAPTILSDLNGYSIRNVRISLWRQGAWYVNNSNSVTLAPVPITSGGGVSFYVSSAANIPLPASLSLRAGQKPLDPSTPWGPYLLVCVPHQSRTSGPDYPGLVHILAVGGGTRTNTTWSTVADGSAAAGSVWRYTPTTTGQAAIYYDLAARAGRRGMLFVKCRVNSTSTFFLARLLASAGGHPYYGRPTIIAGQNGLAQIVSLGRLDLTEDWTRVGMTIQASATSGSLEIESFVVVYLDTPPVHLSVIPQLPSGFDTAHLLNDYPSIEIPHSEVPSLTITPGDYRVPMIQGRATAGGALTGRSYRPVTYGHPAIWLAQGDMTLFFTGVFGPYFAPFGSTRVDMTALLRWGEAGLLAI